MRAPKAMPSLEVLDEWFIEEPGWRASLAERLSVLEHN
jgi:hypothetical protein